MMIKPHFLAEAFLNLCRRRRWPRSPSLLDLMRSSRARAKFSKNRQNLDISENTLICHKKQRSLPIVSISSLRCNVSTT